MERLDRTTFKRIRPRNDELADNPLNPRLSKQLEMDTEKRYSRAGNWRIIFAVNELEQVLEVAVVQDQQSVDPELRIKEGRGSEAFSTSGWMYFGVGETK